MDDAGVSGSASTEEEKQLFESSMDKTFQRFADRLAQNPEQVLRYEFGGQPLLYSSTDVVGKMLDPHYNSRNSGSKVTTGNRDTATNGMPRCQNCGAERVFELQLVPHAITMLEEDEDVGLEGMDWGTVILGVCSKDCTSRDTREGEVGYVEEWVGVQWEELALKNSG
jgi:pre-rRNA-processing protein TSR4